jgi:hypothetical protein
VFSRNSTFETQACVGKELPVDCALWRVTTSERQMQERRSSQRERAALERNIPVALVFIMSLADASAAQASTSMLSILSKLRAALMQKR